MGTLHTVIYRASLRLPEQVSGPDRDALHEFLATATRRLEYSPDLLAEAQHAFTFGVQTVSLIAAVLLAIAAAVAYKVIPSPAERARQRTATTARRRRL